jgi:RES domain
MKAGDNGAAGPAAAPRPSRCRGSGERTAARVRSLAAEIEDFARHLERFPYLGLTHPVGKRVAATVARAPKVTLEAAEWHRARLPQGPDRFGTRDLGPPPATRAEGRFNHYGQTVFYLASSQYGACAETVQRRRGIVWVQRWRVRRFRRLLDLAGAVSREQPCTRRGHDKAGTPLLTAGLNAVFRRLRPDSDSPWKPEYFVPRFVADTARQAGFRGILYCSTRFEGYDAVLFEWTAREIGPRGEPEIVDFSAKSPPRPAARAARAAT